MNRAEDMFKTIEYTNEKLVVLDQTLLPAAVVYETLDTVESVFDAIQKLKVRGAPLIGVAAAYGVLVGVREYKESPTILEEVAKVCSYLNAARPTAVNLSWALNRMQLAALAARNSAPLYESLVAEAQKIHAEDLEINRRIGEQTYELVKDKIKDNAITIMTHCNAGALATTGYGTATSVMYALRDKGVKVKVFASETRPLLQGARLTAWELMEAGIEVTLITDNMAATVLASGVVDFVIVGADRVAANLDVANKVGTLGVSIIAERYGVPFYVACPSPSFDVSTACGKDIVIEEREGSEITSIRGVALAPDGVATFNPAFDITPHDSITAVVTEEGVLRR